MNSNLRCYSELVTLPTFKERFNYLKLNGRVGESTFGFDRYLNQKFYKLPEWRKTRRDVILRDNGCDLGLEDREIPGGCRIYVHHMNPMSVKDIANKLDWILDPEYLICVMGITHRAIHYGDETLLYSDPVERMANDTIPWR